MKVLPNDTSLDFPASQRLVRPVKTSYSRELKLHTKLLIPYEDLLWNRYQHPTFHEETRMRLVAQHAVDFFVLAKFH